MSPSIKFPKRPALSRKLNSVCSTGGEFQAQGLKYKVGNPDSEDICSCTILILKISGLILVSIVDRTASSDFRHRPILA